MKVLIDENLDHRLRKNLLTLTRHEILTVQYLGWTGLKNGELLKTAEINGIEILVPGDQSLTFQQNLDASRLAIVTLSAINWPIIKNHALKIAAAINNAVPALFNLWSAADLAERRTAIHKTVSGRPYSLN